MDIKIKEIENDESQIKSVQEFLYAQIKIEYGIGPMPEFHYDIDGLKDYYILPKRNAFFAAYDGDKIVATAGVRAYDKDYEFFKGQYNEENTASIWRLMVDEQYRRNGLARILVKKIEEFAKEEGYKEIYLNTHRYLEAALPFWNSLGYTVTIEEDDYDETNHMIKVLV
ncbi:acetyltransferase GNAT family [Methanobrevibacter ruminantium M1]|uniref:Acetyltransferase GNAT family n=1 Tax=Methanobrevibacter ruminantium (strain ATCC 35063 / DSM 1093 / JCM 13430 / OCM 146 / M1) TaxID=634498 RepID=D3DZ07_METRM|nr:GNAT family N-acetyltransferase [Methanobrevibacter ruminantium]ADC47557.1 acetyltransferase GNAT family [Methanobrevibacter ruminantium M1]